MTYSSSCHHHLHHPLLQKTLANPCSPGKWPLKRRLACSRARTCVSKGTEVGLILVYRSNFGRMPNCLQFWQYFVISVLIYKAECLPVCVLVCY